MLSDPEKRALYAQSGEDGLRRGVGFGAQAFDPRSAQALFEDMLRGFAATERSARCAPAPDVFASGFGSGACGGGDGPAARALPKDAPFEMALPCSLEELHSGSVRRMRVGRRRLAHGGAPGATVQDSEILTINVGRGWRRGTRVTFPEKGDELPGRIPADVVFVVEERPHERFTREGNDLVTPYRLTLADALCGARVALRTLGGEEVVANVPGPIAPGSEHVLVGLGMPLPRSPDQTGNLRIKFDVVFPTHLDDGVKAQLRALLPHA